MGLYHDESLNELRARLLICGFVSFGTLIGMSVVKDINNSKAATKNITAEENKESNTGIYEIGTHEVIINTSSEEFNNTINNISDGYELEKVEKIKNNEYDIYLINNEKVVVSEDNKCGIVIEDNKVKTK